MNIQSKIDLLIESLYTKNKYSELNALSKLHSAVFLNKLQLILNSNAQQSRGFSETFSVKSGWIDKIPVAEFVHKTYDINSNLIVNRVEIGDMLLVYKKSIKIKSQQNSKNTPLENRAIYLQAKLCDESNPLVPIGKLNSKKVNSTSKELALLSTWPEFNLYVNGNSNTSLLNNLKLDANKNNRYFAGYYEKKWFVGEPIFNQKCNITFGELIENLVNNKSGEQFTIKDYSSHWNMLVNKTIDICSFYNLPKSIFGRIAKRFSFLNYLFSYVSFFFFFFFLFPEPRFYSLIIEHTIEE